MSAMFACQSNAHHLLRFIVSVTASPTPPQLRPSTSRRLKICTPHSICIYGNNSNTTFEGIQCVIACAGFRVDSPLFLLMHRQCTPQTTFVHMRIHIRAQICGHTHGFRPRLTVLTGSDLAGGRRRANETGRVDR